MIGLIVGPQGSGKGTQAKLIQKDFGFKHSSMGELLRIEKEKDTDEGREIKRIVEEGELVPEKITNILAKSVLGNNEKVLFDGYPRNVKQAEFLIENNFKVDFIIVVMIGEDESVKRLGKRRICTANNKILISDKITDKDIEDCKREGGEIITRKDDEPEAIKKRLQIYHEKTEPLIKLFEDKGAKIIEVNGEQTIDKVYEDIKKEFGLLMQQ